MSTLQVANLHFESTGNNRLQYTGSNAINIVAGGTIVATANSTQFAVNGVVVSGFPSGTKMMFVQTSAPTGWTKDTTHDNKALRVVSGAASSGGTVAFTTAFASQAVSGTVGSTTLTTAQIPAHTHTINSGTNAGLGISGGTSSSAGTLATSSTGGGGSHNHAFTGTAIDLAVQYVDVIIATKD